MCCAWCKNVKMRKDVCGMICKISGKPVKNSAEPCGDYLEYKHNKK